jgi:hypothetical protein
LYVGKDPTDFDIDSTENFLYVANKGPGTGLPGSWRIAVVALTNQTLVTSYITPTVAVNVTAGRPGLLYYNSGFYDWNVGDARAINTDTGADLGSFASVKTRMVISSSKTRLFGQYVYDGNLGAMGVFNVSSNQISLIDSLGYSPYPYGWDYDNYTLSADNRFISYGKILFNPTNLMDQIGEFSEQIYALNNDGSVAFGQTSIWSTVTFPIHGNATKITDMPFPTSVMAFDSDANILYASANNSLYQIERATTHGIPFRWLTNYGLSINDSVELQDPDNDGLNTLQEWELDCDPTNSSPLLRLEWIQPAQLKIQNTSTLRSYELQKSEDLNSANWQYNFELQGSGSNLVFNVATNGVPSGKAFYRLRVKLY